MQLKILSISYDRTLLMTRHLMLQESGFSVVSASTMPELAEALSQSDYHLFILGHSLPSKEKLRVFHLLRANSQSVPILELYKFSPDLDTGFNLSSQTPPEELIKSVEKVLQQSAKRTERTPGSKSRT